MKIIESNHKYVTSEIVEECFVKGELTSVDKVLCGNGFSTGFLNLKVRRNRINIMIAPNLAVIVEKEQAYLNDCRLPLMHKDKVYTTENRIKFFYGDSEDDNFDDANILMFVADSFMMRGDAIRQISHRVDKVLVDEVHSVHQQSLYRKILVDLEAKVVNRFPSNVAIVSVTASPIQFAKVDIKIENNNIPHQLINHSKDRKEALERIHNDLDMGENVVVFTNNSGVIFNLSKKNDRSLDGKFVLGDSLYNSISKKVTVRENPDSNLTVVSSRGFEGFDIMYEDARVYFFEDRSSDYESFSIGNLYQAVNRCRKGASYVEYCRQEVSERHKSVFKDIKKEVDSFILQEDISTEKKLSGKYKKFRPYIIRVQGVDGIKIKANAIAINLYLEKEMYNLEFPQKGIMQFAKDRNITFNKIETMSKRIKTRTDRDVAIEMLYLNKNNITKRNSIPADYHLKVDNLWSKDNVETPEQLRKAYHKALDMYLIEKNYAQDYTKTDRQVTALNILDNPMAFQELCDHILEMYVSSKKKKHTRAEATKRIKSFKNYLPTTVAQLIMSFARDTISFDNNQVAWRDYNLGTKVGISQLREVSETIFQTKLDEYDIVSAFPRILYAINGKNLPDDFYGENKKNKEAMNVYLNNFGYDETKSSSKKLQKQRVKDKLRGFNVDEDVIAWLIDNYFESEFRGDLFNKLAYYEEQIISELIEIIRDGGNCKNEGLVRRHDSVIVFGNEDNLDYISYFTPKIFPNTTGWFR